jgi:hypothetical protein
MTMIFSAALARVTSRNQRMSGRIRFADKDTRQHEKLRRFPIQYYREALCGAAPTHMR